MPVHDEDIHEYTRDLLRLERPVLHFVSLLVADRELVRAYKDGAFKNLASIADEQKKSEVVRLAIEIATTYRLTHWNRRSPSSSESVGKLFEAGPSGPHTELTMLEACHKVVHAEFVAFESRKLPRSYASFFKPRLHLAGTKSRKEWFAILEALPFADAALEPTNIGQ
jgi:hypothetical protein